MKDTTNKRLFSFLDIVVLSAILFILWFLFFSNRPTEGDLTRSRLIALADAIEMYHQMTEKVLPPNTDSYKADQWFYFLKEFDYQKPTYLDVVPSHYYVLDKAKKKGEIFDMWGRKISYEVSDESFLLKSLGKSPSADGDDIIVIRKFD